MSEHETPLTLAYWKIVKGTLIEEYPIVRKDKEYYIILDGVHRAAVMLNHNLKHIKCVEYYY